ncbi:hypothetical protein F4808DRAFT_65909 [Astrocystis sublimbata]|nr:hypothetical protein F4808DRAFT_65909 [Astrocystis sublimbata]
MDELDADSDVGFNGPSGLEIPDFSVDYTGISSCESSSTAQENSTRAQRRYLSKRPHRKSRAGCKQCKKRKVKCDEARPACKACTLRKEQCVYPSASVSTRQPAGTDAVPNSTAPPPRSPSESTELIDTGGVFAPDRGMVRMVSEPLFVPEQTADLVDMKMLWFYTSYSFQSFYIDSGRADARSTSIDYALKIKLVEHAFRSPFLMETIKALTALHLRSLNQHVPNNKIIEYQANAFQGYRVAIAKADPSDYPALLGCSLLSIGMSTQTFRDPNGQRLYIVEWISMWRGIGLIINLITEQGVLDSGLAPMFYRPPLDLEKAACYIPNDLLFMVTSIQPEDADYDCRDEYYEFLKFLGTLYLELIEDGIGAVLDLRIITLFTHCPYRLLQLAKLHRPRMLIIVAHWLCFVKIMQGSPWWTKGLTSQVDQIVEEVGESWAHMLTIPRIIVQTDDVVKMARLLSGNQRWRPGRRTDLAHTERVPPEVMYQSSGVSENVRIELMDSPPKSTDMEWETEIPIIPGRARETDGSDDSLLIGTNLLYNVTPKSLATALSPAASSRSPSTPALSPSSSSSHSLSP